MVDRNWITLSVIKLLPTRSFTVLLAVQGSLPRR